MKIENHPFIQSLSVEELEGVLEASGSISMAEGDAMDFSDQGTEILHLIVSGRLAFFNGFKGNSVCVPP